MGVSLTKCVGVCGPAYENLTVTLDRSGKIMYDPTLKNVITYFHFHYSANFGMALYKMYLGYIT